MADLTTKCAVDSSDEILVLTAYQGDTLGLSRFRIEKRQHNLVSADEEIRYLGEGPLDGVLVCASEGELRKQL